VGFLILQQMERTQTVMAMIGPYKVGAATYFITGAAMIIGSLVKHKLVKS
jgi:hypothetical protein